MELIASFQVQRRIVLKRKITERIVSACNVFFFLNNECESESAAALVLKAGYRAIYFSLVRKAVRLPQEIAFLRRPIHAAQPLPEYPIDFIPANAT